MNLIVSIPYTITTRVSGDKFWKLERTETAPKMATGTSSLKSRLFRDYLKSGQKPNNDQRMKRILWRNEKHDSQVKPGYIFVQV